MSEPDISIKVYPAVGAQLTGDGEKTFEDCLSGHRTTRLILSPHLTAHLNNFKYIRRNVSLTKLKQLKLKPRPITIFASDSAIAIKFRQRQKQGRPCIFGSHLKNPFTERELPIDLTCDDGMNMKPKEEVKIEVKPFICHPRSSDICDTSTVEHEWYCPLSGSSNWRTNGTGWRRVSNRHNVRVGQNRLNNLQLNRSEETFSNNVALEVDLIVDLVIYKVTRQMFLRNHFNQSLNTERFYSSMSLHFKRLINSWLLRDDSKAKVINSISISNVSSEAAVMNIMYGPLFSTPTCEAKTPSPAAGHKNSDSWSCKILTICLS